MIIKAAKVLYKLKNEKYLLSILYYYFNILNLYSEEMYDLLKMVDKDDSINKDNIQKQVEEKRIDYLNNNKKDISNYIGYSSNCFIGRDNHIPDMIVCYITSNYESAISNFYNPVSEVSSHFIINKEGEIKQIIDLKDSAWANGTSMNQDSDVYYKFATNKLVSKRDYNANYFTFSIEHESFDGSLTEKQYQSSLKVIKKIIEFMKEEYNHDFIIDEEHLVGHNEVNPIVRTMCPGPKFPFKRLINDLKK